MKKIFLSTVIFLFSLSCYAQEAEKIETSPKIAKNLFYGELGGRGLLFSVNYERMLYYNPNYKITGRIGFGGAGTLNLRSNMGGGGGIFTMPIGLNLLLGKGKNHFEIGGGLTYFNENGYGELRPMLGFGYRLQKPEGGFFLNTNLNFMMYNDGSRIAFPIPSLGIGYSF